MSNSRSPSPIANPQDWFLSPAGRYVAQWALATTDSLLVDVFGLQAAQVGSESLDLLAHNRIQHRFRCVAPGEPPIPTTVAQTPWGPQADPAALPFENDSLDLLVLPYVLEFHNNPHQVLREAQRVLRPEGQLLILGFNPFSLWGLRNALSHAINHAQTPNLPWPGHYLSIQRLKDWLKLLDFEVSRGHFGCYAPPCRNERHLQHLHWLESAGDRWWGFAGGCYALKAVKRVGGMTLLTPSWQSTQKKLVAKPALVTEHHMPKS